MSTYLRPLVLLQALTRRIRALDAAGVACILAGDLNVSPFLLDNCDPDVVSFEKRPDRRLLRSLLLGQGGFMLDTFRVHHPHR